MVETEPVTHLVRHDRDERVVPAAERHVERHPEAAGAAPPGAPDGRARRLADVLRVHDVPRSRRVLGDVELDDRSRDLPVARRAPASAIDNQVLWAFGNLGVEVVHEHAKGGFLQPALAREFDAARRANEAGCGHGGKRATKVATMATTGL